MHACIQTHTKIIHVQINYILTMHINNMDPTPYSLVRVYKIQDADGMSYFQLEKFEK